MYACMYACPRLFLFIHVVFMSFNILSPSHLFAHPSPFISTCLPCLVLHCIALLAPFVAHRISGVCYVSLVHLGYISDQGGVLFGGGAPLPLPGGPPKDNTNPNPLPDSSSSSSLSSSSSSSSSDSFYAPIAKRDPFAPPPTYRPSMAIAHHATMVPSLGNSGR